MFFPEGERTLMEGRTLGVYQVRVKAQNKAAAKAVVQRLVSEMKINRNSIKTFIGAKPYIYIKLVKDGNETVFGNLCANIALEKFFEHLSRESNEHVMADISSSELELVSKS